MSETQEIIQALQVLGSGADIHKRNSLAGCLSAEVRLIERDGPTPWNLANLAWAEREARCFLASGGKHKVGPFYPSPYLQYSEACKRFLNDARQLGIHWVEWDGREAYFQAEVEDPRDRQFFLTKIKRTREQAAYSWTECCIILSALQPPPFHLALSQGRFIWGKSSPFLLEGEKRGKRAFGFPTPKKRY